MNSPQKKPRADDQGAHVYCILIIVLAGTAAFSGLGKLRRDPNIVHIAAACEFAGGVGAGSWDLVAIPKLAAGIRLVVYFLGAIVSQVRVGDVSGIGPAAFMLIISVAAVVLRALTAKTGAAG